MNYYSVLGLLLLGFSLGGIVAAVMVVISRPNRRP